MGEIQKNMGTGLLERFREAGLEATGQRRNVTVLFVDLAGYTPLSESLDPEVLYEIMQKYIRVLADSVHNFDGMVDKLTGDGLMALFGAPMAYENNAERAIRAALEMQEAVAQLNLEFREQLQGHNLSVHMGINNGTVVVGGVGNERIMNYTAIGDTVNIAARLEEISKEDEILVSETIFRRTQPLFDYREPKLMELKGIKDPLYIYQVVGYKANPGSTRGLKELGVQYVGHQTDIRQILAMINTLKNDKLGGLLLVTGEAGIGKSRMMREVQSRLDQEDVTLMVGHTLTYRKSIPYWIFQDVFRNFWQLKQFGGEIRHEVMISIVEELMGNETQQILPYLEYLMGMNISDDHIANAIEHLDGEQLRLRIFLTVRRVLVKMARQKPLVLVLDDLHWADEGSLDLINFLVDTVEDEPILIYGISRPYEGGAVERIRSHAERVLSSQASLFIQLKPLELNETHELFNIMIQLEDFPAKFREEIIRRSAGLPLYMEEILRMLIEDNVIYFQNDAWKLNPSAKFEVIGVPETLQGLILARFDRLNLTQRHVIQSAAVIGNPFDINVLDKMLDKYTRKEIVDTLHFLTQHDFIEPQAYGLSRRYRFRHGLVSDAIYSTLLGRERKNLHQQVAEAIEEISKDHLEDQVEILAHHYSRSYQLDMALKYLVQAGKKAMRDYANEQARQHFVTALGMLSKIGYTTEQAFDIQTGLGDILVVNGEYPAARRHYATALEIILEDGTPEWLRQQSTLHRKIAMTFERQGDYEKALARLQAAEMVLTESAAGDRTELASIYNDIGWTHFRRGNVEIAEKHLMSALEIVMDTDEYQVIASVYNRLGGIYFTKGDMDKADFYTRRSLELREKMGELALAARSYNNLGLIAWKRGMLPDAMRYFEQSFETQKELGDIEVLIELNTNMGFLQMEYGRPEQAEQYILEAIELARKAGHSHHLSTCYVHLTELYLQLSSYEKALEFRDKAEKELERIGGNEFKVTLQVQAGLANLGYGNKEEARAASKEALRLLKEYEKSAQVGLDDQAGIFQLLGRIAQEEGQLARARYYYQRAIELLKKSNRPLPAARLMLHIVELLVVEKNTAEARKWLREAEQVFSTYRSYHELESLQELAKTINGS
ncbi:MAG: tetratricopeptide repeat protein [Anaerolineae bacterium]|nr:tetratricopeptide repeat protein [Anaerolineae bacterium]